MPPVEQPTATPTPTLIPTASLSGSVKNPDGSQPLVGTSVLLMDLPVFSASTGSGGAYAMTGLPLGRHFVVATDPLGAVSDSYQVPMSGDTVLNINLQRFPAGQPTLFIGHVVSTSRSAVGGASVWRIGGAGLTTSRGNGTFTLVDASRGDSDPSSTTLGPAPPSVVFVAVKDDTWGMLPVDTKNAGKLEIMLDQHGTPPPRPGAQRFSNNMTVQARGDQYFTARWPSNQNLSGPTIHIKGNQGFESSTGAVGGGACVGDCGNAVNEITWLVAKLPRGQEVKLDLQDSSGQPWGGNPVWDEPQVVRLNP
jgi:hypothetical protein